METTLLFTINEALKTKTKTKQSNPSSSTFQDDFDNLGQTKNVPSQRQKADTPELRRATAELTRRRTGQVEMPPEAAEKLSFLNRLGLEDEISDEEAARRAGVTRGEADQTPPEPTTMPAVISQEIAAEEGVEPEWHAVRNLPGYLQNGIRAMGRQVFGTFTKTPIEDIEVIANLGGQGPNDTRELSAVAGWLRKNAERHTEGEMNFAQSIPDYGAEFVMYKAEGRTFLLVKDFAGKYIYSWPTADEKGSKRGNLGLRNEVQRRRMR